MLSLLRDLDTYSYTHRTYVVGVDDEFSTGKAAEFERGLWIRGCVGDMERALGGEDSESSEEEEEDDAFESSDEEEEGEDIISEGARGRELHRSSSLSRKEEKEKPKEDTAKDEPPWENDGYGTYTIHLIPRARAIHQSLLTTPFSALMTLLACLHLLTAPRILPEGVAPGTSQYPDLILANGPATATILLLASKLLKLLAGIGFPGLSGTKGKMRAVYVESWARVRGLSLSGKMVCRFGLAERVLGQWEGLGVEGWWAGGAFGRGRGKGKGRQVEFRGVLVG